MNCCLSNFCFYFKVSGDFWAAWKDFEVRHGNEDTIREMLRIKRSIQALYNTQFTANLISQQTAQSLSDSTSTENENRQENVDPMANLAKQQLEGVPKRAGDVSFVRGETLLQPSTVSDKTENPDEIKLDDEDEEEKSVSPA